MQKYQRDNCKNILLGIIKVGGVLTITFVAPGAAPTLLKPFLNNNRVDKRKLNKTLKYMKDNGLIGIKENRNQTTLVLKNKGKTKALKYNLEQLTIIKPSKWDHKWRLALFDIPEKYKTARNVFKDKLDELGFKQIQKSVYVFPYPCEDEIEMIRSIYNLRPFVKIVIASSVEGESKLKKHFDLN